MRDREAAKFVLLQNLPFDSLELGNKFDFIYS